MEISDSVEYATASQHLVADGHYAVTVDGIDHPPRYPPGFSLVLAPLYALTGGPPGIGVLFVFGCALIVAWCVYWIGWQAGGPVAGVTGAVALMSYDEFCRHCQLVMSDVPVTACGLLVCLLVIRAIRRGDIEWWLVVAAGALSFTAGMIRPLHAAIALPTIVLCVWKKEFWKAIIPLLSVAVAAIFNIGYNRLTFGDWHRTGYHYWWPNIYAVEGRTFYAGMVRTNISLVIRRDWRTAVLCAMGLACGLWLVVRSRAVKRTQSFSRAKSSILGWGLVLLFGAGPIVLIHLFYFYVEQRFYFTAQVLAMTMLGVPAAILLRRYVAAIEIPLAIGMCGVLLLLAKPTPVHSATPGDWEWCSGVRAHTESDAVVVTDRNPFYLEDTAFADSRRLRLPLNPQWMPVPPTIRVRRSNAAIFAGRSAREPDLLTELVQQESVYVDGQLLQDPSFTKILDEQFELLAVHDAPGLFRLDLARRSNVKEKAAERSADVIKNSVVVGSARKSAQ